MISVCFITKNEEKWLQGCIQNLKSCVSEFIVLDTGSTDRTVEIARECGAKVYQVEWLESFSKARNLAMSYATQPWILRVDPDERISEEDQKKILELCKSNEFDAYEFFTRGYTNSQKSVEEACYRGCSGEFKDFEEGFKGYNNISYIRLFRNQADIQYEGDVHEDVKHSCKRISVNRDIHVHHYGWDEAEVSRKGKRGLYEKMMLQEIEKRPNDYFLYYELGMLYLREENFGRAEQVFEFAAKMVDSSGPRAEILSNWGLVLMKMGRLNQAEDVIAESLSLNAQLASTWLNWGSLMIAEKKFEDAVAGLKQAVSQDAKNSLAWRLLGQAAAAVGDVKLAERAFNSALNLAPQYEDASLDLAILYHHFGARDRAQKLVEDCLVRNPGSDAARSLLNQWA